jgi:hypothetical protein
MRSVELTPVVVPEFGCPVGLPELPPAEYEARLAAMRARMREEGLDFLVVYGDREHAANVAFLTGYDPRFEETLLVIGPAGAAAAAPLLLVGNEGLAYSAISPLDLERSLYQTFSLLGQPRDRSKPLGALLADTGLRRGSRIGVAGWKYFDRRETPTPAQWLETPAFIVDTLRELAGGREHVTNATALLMDPEVGLRATNSADQLAYFECVATYCSQSVRDLLAGLRPGMTEFAAIQLMRLNGIPTACHPNLGSGPRVALGMMSPSGRVLQPGDPVLIGLGLQGALVARAGFLAHGPADLPAGAADYVDAVAKPYFAAAAAWWESLAIGASAGEIAETVIGLLKPAGLGPALNPGHLIHLDEWVNSPFFIGSPHRLRSGMALQCDIIPTPPAPYAPSNVEDGLALADEPLRAELARKHPASWARIEQRRRFMAESLGLRLRPEVLPFSNWPAVLTPYLLEPGLALRMAA